MAALLNAVRETGGDIEIDTTLGQGTLFRITIGEIKSLAQSA